ncbi:MAG TPA: hypothetical protein VFD41_11900 [Actinomycetales bacterium]|nr:hypothetical protein [Actinomycetales bacterium]
MGVPDAGRMAAACAMVGVDAHVVPLERGSAVVPVDDAGEAAVRISRVLGRAEVLVLRHDDAQVVAERWQRGAVRDRPAPGVVMAGMPDVVERLLLGADPADVEGAVSSVGIPRGAAARETMSGFGSRLQRWDRPSTLVIGVAALLLGIAETPRALEGTGSWVVVVLSLLVVAWTAARLLRRRP